MRGFLGRTIASHFRCHPRDTRFHPFSDHFEPVDEWSMYFCTVPFPYPHYTRAAPPLGLSFFGCVAAMETTTVYAGSKVLSTRRGGLCVCIGVERKSRTATPPRGPPGYILRMCSHCRQNWALSYHVLGCVSVPLHKAKHGHRKTPSDAFRA